MHRSCFAKSMSCLFPSFLSRISSHLFVVKTFVLPAIGERRIPAIFGPAPWMKEDEDERGDTMASDWLSVFGGHDDGGAKEIEKERRCDEGRRGATKAPATTLKDPFKWRAFWSFGWLLGLWTFYNKYSFFVCNVDSISKSASISKAGADFFILIVSNSVLIPKHWNISYHLKTSSAIASRSFKWEVICELVSKVEPSHTASLPFT